MQTWILCFFGIDILIYTTLNGRNYSKHFFRSGKQQKYSILNWISETQSSKALLPWHIALGFKVPNAVMQFSLGFFSWVFLLIKRFSEVLQEQISNIFLKLLVREKLLKNSIFYIKRVGFQSTENSPCMGSFHLVRTAGQQWKQLAVRF